MPYPTFQSEPGPFRIPTPPCHVGLASVHIPAGARTRSTNRTPEEESRTCAAHAQR